MDSWGILSGRPVGKITAHKDMGNTREKSMTPRAELEMLEHTTPLNELRVDSDEYRWLKRCLPVIAQPKVDLENENHLVKLMYRFERDGEKNQLHCKLYVIYAGESSYRRVNENKQNACATLFYRSFNRKVYKRTADINYIEYRDIDLTPDAETPWRTIFTTDHAGKQTWAQGDKANIFSWFSLMHHYRVELSHHEWQIHQLNRPIFYLNTCNHMWGDTDNNPQLEKHLWTNYPIQSGTAEDAVEFSKHHIPTKHNFYSCCCFWRARNGGGCCDRVVHTDLEHSGASFYILEEDSDKV